MSGIDKTESLCVDVYNECLENYVVLRLCRLLWSKVEQIRSLIGMCHSYYLLKNNVFFVNSRPTDIMSYFLVNSKEGYMFYFTPVGVKCLFACEHIVPQTVFLNTPISRNVYRWSIYLEYGPKTIRIFRIGVGSLEFMKNYSDSLLGDNCGSCSFCFFTTLGFHPQLGFSVHGVKTNNGVEDMKYGVTEQSLVSVEVDANKRRMVLFVNGKQIPYAISHLPVPLHIGISGLPGQAFTFVGFSRLPTFSPSSTVNVVCECR